MIAAGVTTAAVAAAIAIGTVVIAADVDRIVPAMRLRLHGLVLAVVGPAKAAAVAPKAEAIAATVRKATAIATPTEGPRSSRRRLRKSRPIPIARLQR